MYKKYNKPFKSKKNKNIVLGGYYMLKYEKKLNLDKHYEKLIKNDKLKNFYSVLLGIISYIFLYFIAKYVLTFLPDFQPWGDFEVWFYIGRIEISKVDLVYFLYGLLLSVYGLRKLLKITIQNHSVKDKRDNIPKSLLINGFYSKVRHPMYGTFIILYAGFMLSLKSLIGVIIALIIIFVQYLNAFYEERKKLIPIFREEYEFYTNNVQSMLLIKFDFFAVIIGILFNTIGFVF